jgi:uncharacterized protein (DUF362 family)
MAATGQPPPASPVVAISYVSEPRGDLVAAAIRDLLRAVLRSSSDDPLGPVLPDPLGRTVVIKPNLVRHFNPKFSLEAVVTSPLVVRGVAELARQAVGPSGRVIVADSPQNDCDFEVLLGTPGWRELRLDPVLAIEFIDLRDEQVVMTDGVVVSRLPLSGDPEGSRTIDVGDASAFEGSGLAIERLRGSDYDPEVTRSAHADGNHRYAVCATFLEADLLIVVPKVKTHKKVGLSLAMKNLVGLVSEKNCLPHHTAGFAGRGGDEYPVRSMRTASRQWMVERARPLLAKGRHVRAFRALRRLEGAVLPEVTARSGNWWGNDTAWRMVVDLVAILAAERYQRAKPTLFVYDALVVGEGEGPLAPEALVWNMLAATDHPVAGDIAVARELGLDPARFPLLVEALARRPWPGDAEHAEVRRVTTARPGRTPRLHPGWVDGPRRVEAGHG